jgi:cell division protein FtsZ
MGIGSAKGEQRAIRAAEVAISNPLLEASIDGAHGVLIQIAGASDLGLHEIDEATRLVSEAVSQGANIIFGSTIDDTLGDEVRVTVIAAGFDDNALPYRKAERDVFATKSVESAAEPVSAAPAWSNSYGQSTESAASATPVAAAVNDVEEVVAPVTSSIPQVPASKPAGSLWGDDLDIPDFLR